MGDRKARLAALAAKAGRTKSADDVNPAENDRSEKTFNSKQQPVAFRNYAPNDSKLESSKPNQGGESPSKRRRTDDADNSSKPALQTALQQAQSEITASRTTLDPSKRAKPGAEDGTEVSALAPKKINWDLKRDIGEKLAKLERRTQKAIVGMLKERLEKEAAEQVNSDESDLD